MYYLVLLGESAWNPVARSFTVKSTDFFTVQNNKKGHSPQISEILCFGCQRRMLTIMSELLKALDMDN